MTRAKKIAAAFAVGIAFFGAPGLIPHSDSRAAHAAIFNPDVFTLKNGMQVVVVSNHRVPVVTHMVWYKVGAMDEPPGKSGLAHYFEHLMFKGTDKLAPGEFSKIVAENGGRENAFTSQDYTGYYQSVAIDRLGLMMEIEANRMTNLVLTEDVIRPELKVILEERPAVRTGRQRDVSEPPVQDSDHRLETRNRGADPVRPHHILQTLVSTQQRNLGHLGRRHR
jgi:hypothetical protein